jgi:hypothetical protein
MLVALLLGGVGGYYVGKGKKPTIQRDTVTFHDTITEYEPKEVERIVVRKEKIPVHDTTCVHDTAFVELPVERVVYADSNYRAVVSGIRPSLDEISVYPETKIITQTITVTEPGKKGRFSIGAQAGWYVIYDAAHKQVATGPGAGAGLSFGWTF